MLTSRHTWTAIIYMIFQMPLGIIYFTVIVTLVAAAAWMIGRPIWELTFELPAFVTSSYAYFTPWWGMLLYIIGGILLLTTTMHLVKAAGWLHGNLAKAMLVRE